MQPDTVTAASNGFSIEVIILAITVLVMGYQTFQASRSIYAGSFKAAFDILQEESVRDARRLVLHELASKREHTKWSATELAAAEKVIHTYDAVGVMVRSGLIPTHMVANHWGDSLRRAWPILKPLVLEIRQKRNAQELFDDFEWLGEEAKKYPQHRRWFL